MRRSVGSVGSVDRPVRALAVCGLLVGAGLAVFAPGCKEEKKSLVIVDLQATGGDGTGVSFVEISIGEPDPSTAIAVKKVFDLPATGLPPTTGNPYEVGVWIPAGVVGSLPVTAVAKPVQGCAGYVGMKSIKIGAGDTKPVVLLMRPSADVCTITGTGGSMGTAGSGGTTGVGGSSGSTGSAGTGGSTPPGSCGTTVGTPVAAGATATLTNCVEFDSAPSPTCDPTLDTNNAGIVNMAVSPDGQLLATSTNNSYFDGVVKIWNLQGGTPTQCGPTFTKANRGPGLVAFSPDGQFFAIAWNGEYVYTYRVPTFGLVGVDSSDASNYLYGVGFSADSQTLFYVDWDGASGGTLYADHLDGSAITKTTLGVDPDAFAVAPVAVGGVTSMAVSGSDGNFGFYTWSGAAFGAPVVKTTIANGVGESVAFSRNGMMLAEGTNDGSVRFWAVPVTAASTPVGNIMPPGKPYGLSFSPAGDALATASSEVNLWNVSTRTFIARHNVTPPAGGSTQYADATVFSASGGALFVGEDQCNKFLVCQ